VLKVPCLYFRPHADRKFSDTHLEKPGDKIVAKLVDGDKQTENKYGQEYSAYGG
jgi:hypothetical protein